MLRPPPLYKIEARGNIAHRGTVSNSCPSLTSYSVGTCSINLVTGAMWTMDIGLSSSVEELLTRVAGLLGSIPGPAICFQCSYLFLLQKTPIITSPWMIHIMNSLCHHLLFREYMVYKRWFVTVKSSLLQQIWPYPVHKENTLIGNSVLN